MRHDGIALRIHEVQQLRHHFAVQRERGTGNRAAAQRTNIDPLKTIRQPLMIALDHLNVSQQMMRKINRLRPLQMRVTRDNHAGIFSAQFHQRPLQAAQFLAQAHDFIPQP